VPIVFGPVMNIIASILANWWRAHPAELPVQVSRPGSTATQTNTTEN
jgi:hypothetical protein